MDYEEVAFNVIRYSAEAKSKIMEALDKLDKNDMDGTDVLIKEAKDCLVKAQLSHAKMIQEEAEGTKHEFSILIIHAEDQLMNVEILLDMYYRFESIYAKIN